jgi:hypothetical protein
MACRVDTHTVIGVLKQRVVPLYSGLRNSLLLGCMDGRQKIEVP